MDRRSLAFLFSVSLLLGSFMTRVHAAEDKSRFDLPAEPLGKALRDFAVQANCNISYEPALVLGLQAPAIKGDLTASDALAILLKGTHLHAVNIDEHTIQVLGEASVPAPVHIAYAGADTPPPGTPAPGASPRAASGPSDTPIAPPPDSASAGSGTGNDEGLEEVVVTGTSIHGVENKTVPLLTFDRDAIDRSGYASIGDFIDSLPQNVKSGGNSADGVLTGNGLGNIENATSANLRGLGASSTLTLLNGHRVAASSFGTGVDLSMIPLSAVERIEVLTDGSSAVYGSDAVGGVVNIILRKDFNGAETSARLDTLTQGGGEQKQLGQSVGKTWATGGALLVLQFDDDNAIHGDQRSFTANLPEPTDIYPSAKRYSGVFSGHQTLSDSLELVTDILADHNEGFRAFTTGGLYSTVELLDNKTNSQSANLGLRWQPFGDWHLEADTLFSQVDTLAIEDFIPSSFGYTNGTPYLRNLDTLKEADLKLDGTLGTFGGSNIKAAVGASYRREHFSSLIPYTDADRPFDRRVSAAYAEVYAPIIGTDNAVALVRKLELSAAVREDSYSDFGDKIDPRLGLFWSPIDQLSLRTAFSTSFRAPDPSEVLSDLEANTVFIESGYALPNGATGNVIYFGNQRLGPETSRNLTAGLDYLPAALPAARLSLNYYRIVYSNRIISAPQAANVFIDPPVYGPLVKQFPSDAAVEAFVAGLQPPQTLDDFTTGGTGLAGVRYGFPYGDINATKETTEGLDLGAHYLLAMSAGNKLIFDLNSTYIRYIEAAFCSTCESTNLVNTYGQPLKFRARGAAGWSNGAFSANAAVNFSNAYTDTNVLPFGRIDAYTTVDLNASWHIPASPGTMLTFSVTNLFDADPPHTAFAFTGVNYDPVNADPRGRILSLQVRQKW
jgi:iron complex outermembrane receptor protein